MRSWGPSERDVNLNYGTRERRESNAGTCGRGGTPPTDCARDSARSSHRGRRPTRGRDLDRAPCRNLVEHALAPYGAVLSRSELALPGPWLLIALAVLLGLGSNYLGPSAKIHVLWNPIVILIAWNILVYAALTAASVVGRSSVTGQATSEVARPVPRDRPTARGYRPGLVERFFLRPAMSWLLRVKERTEEVHGQASDIGAVSRRFAALWWPVIRPTLRLGIRRALHLCAIGVTAGAVSGMYMRGLFFAYDVVWQSTFINDPEVVGLTLRYLLGPAALVLGYPIPDIEAVARLLTVEGDPAAIWIHLYAVSAFLFIVLPRIFLTFAVTRKLRRAGRFLELDLRAEYYRDLLQAAQAVSPKMLETGVREAVRDECRQVADRLAKFVSVQLYDHRIVPRLWHFRDQGGTLRELEKALGQECQSFDPELEREMLSLEHDLERRLVLRVQRLLGDDRGVVTRPPGKLADKVSAASSRATIHVGERVSGDVAAVVAGVVSASVAVVVGTVSGGFGEALGVALLVGLVESGPVGWIIGAVGALVVTGAAFALGRDRLRQSLKAVPLPAALLKVALWSARYKRLIDKGRTKCHEAVCESLVFQLDQLASQIADHIWDGLRPLVGELQRPRVGREGETV
jgi:hypothetical protein